MRFVLAPSETGSDVLEVAMANNILKYVLTEAGVTQVQLARICNLSIGTINRVCNKSRTPSPTTKSRIVNGLSELTGTRYEVHKVFPEKRRKSR